MMIQIHYCAEWNYKPYAASLAAELKRDLGVDAELVAGSNGIFDVIVDGKKIYSRYDTGAFPAEGEIVSLLKK